MPVHAIRSGPETERHLQAFSAKTICALHYELNKQPLPLSGGIYVKRWTTRDRLHGPVLPPGIERLLSKPQTLRQGKHSDADQFQYAHIIAEDRSVGIYFAEFGLAFAILGIAATDRSFFEGGAGARLHIHWPGNFLSFKDPNDFGSLSTSLVYKLVDQQLNWRLR